MMRVEIPSPSNSGRIGVAGGNSGGIILSAIIVEDDGMVGRLQQVRIQGKNSTGKVTRGAYFRIPAAEAIELAVALVNVALDSKPDLKGEVFSALMRIGAAVHPHV